jgi:hypothetical protein
MLEYRLNNLALEEEDTIRTIYLSNLITLEQAIPDSTTNLDTDRAAVWYRNKDELRDRTDLFNYWCNRLIDFLGIESPSKLVRGQFRMIV